MGKMGFIVRSSDGQAIMVAFGYSPAGVLFREANHFILLDLC